MRLNSSCEQCSSQSSWYDIKITYLQHYHRLVGRGLLHYPPSRTPRQPTSSLLHSQHEADQNHLEAKRRSSWTSLPFVGLLQGAGCCLECLSVDPKGRLTLTKYVKFVVPLPHPIANVPVMAPAWYANSFGPILPGPASLPIKTILLSASLRSCFPKGRPPLFLRSTVEAAPKSRTSLKWSSWTSICAFVVSESGSKPLKDTGGNEGESWWRRYHEARIRVAGNSQWV